MATFDFAKVLLLFCQLFVFGKAELNDKVPRFFWGVVGEGNGAFDTTASTQDGEQNTLMINKVTIGYFDNDGKQDIRCISFSYGDKNNDCVSDYVPEVHTIILEPDEYITEISGAEGFNIFKITVKTNKHQIGPYGQVDAVDTFKVEHGGAPLLFVKVVSGILSVYEMSFTFYETTVDNLGDITNQVAKEAYDVVTRNIMDIFDVQNAYNHMLMEVGKKGCYPFQEAQDPKYLPGCNLQSILSQVNVIATSTSAHLEHSTRNLVPYANYDSAKFLEQVNQASQFHDLMTQIEFDLQVIVDLTAEQSQQLSDYFQTQAEYDLEIAQQDILYIQGQLDRCEAGAAITSDQVGDRMISILDVGIFMVVETAAENLFRLGTVIAENLNPFKWLFGGPEFEDIFEAIDDFFEAIKDLATMAYLRDHVQEYLDLSTEIAKKFADNADQIAAMNELVNKFNTVNDTDELLTLAESYIQAYGGYTPQVTQQDIDYMTAVLSAIGDEACGIIADTGGFVGDITHTIYETVTNNCLMLPADQAKLDSFYQETYSLQFELVDALTAVVRYTVAKHMAENIGAIDDTIDVQTAAMGSAMLEIQFQAACQARCDILEYVDGGLRPAVCKNVLYTDQQILDLIAYKTSLSKSVQYRYAYYPTDNLHQADAPFLDLDKILEGGVVNIHIPFYNPDWLKHYNWLPGVMDPETGFYYEAIEPFIPGLKCNESDTRSFQVYVQAVSSKPQLLYKELEVPGYSIHQQKIKFNYEVGVSPCAGEEIKYPAVRHDSDNLLVADKEITLCVTSKGDLSFDDRDDFTLPSLYNDWNMTISSVEGCTLVRDPEFEFKPMVSFKLRIREVFVKASESDKGTDECWPSGSRCPGQRCVDDVLGYHCEEKMMTEQLLELLLTTMQALVAFFTG